MQVAGWLREVSDASAQAPPEHGQAQERGEQHRDALGSMALERGQTRPAIDGGLHFMVVLARRVEPHMAAFTIVVVAGQQEERVRVGYSGPAAAVGRRRDEPGNDQQARSGDQ